MPTPEEYLKPPSLKDNSDNHGQNPTNKPDPGDGPDLCTIGTEE